MGIEHIYKIASQITESPDEYQDLEDKDEFNHARQTQGYGCGSGCWEFEDIAININGQMLPATAKVQYSAQSYGSYHPGDRYSPPEYPEIEIEDESVSSFEIWTPNGAETLYKWEADKGRDFHSGNSWEAGFQPDSRIMDDEALKNVLNQILGIFRDSEHSVLEYEYENSDDPYDGDY